MKYLFLSIVFLLQFCVVDAQSLRKKTLLNHDWKFALGHAANPEKDFNYGRALSFSKIAFIQESTMLNQDQESRLRIPHTEKFDDSKWEDISIPHDWGMGIGYAKDQFKVKGYRKLGGRSPENSVGWYRKVFKNEFQKGCRYYLEFEGIFRDAQVWMNGIYLGRGESGYVPLFFDITECVNYEKDATNCISVRVDATHSELWSYEGAGIYRNVWLTQVAPVHIAQWGVSVMSDVNLSNKNAVVKAGIEVNNESFEDEKVTITNTLIDADGKSVSSTKKTIVLAAMETEVVETSLNVRRAELWSLENPYLYSLKSEVSVDGKIRDHKITPVGIRSIRFDADEGFFLNGERVQIQGVCCHQDHAGVGIGVPDNLNVWRLEKLKEIGVNAYRASHNPPTESILYACDSLGILVMDELRVLSSSDEGLNQLRTIIKRDRNHPSVIIWCFGNEEPAIQGSEKGAMIIERMKQIQRKLDPSRPCTAAMNGSWGKGFTTKVDVQGFNYFNIGNVDQVHKDFPSLPCILTEEASTLTTRGFYRTDAKHGVYQSYDVEHPGWGTTAQKWMRFVDERKYLAGAFVWTGFDYGGEAAMHYWPGVVSHFGIYDYCGFPKDAAYYYKSWWTNEPVIHILPHWNGIGKDTVDVHLYTNMDEIELFLNNRSLGSQKVGKFDIPKWKVKYEPGELFARGVKDGKEYSYKLETTGSPNHIVLQNEMKRKELDGDGNEVAVITVKIVDKNGRLVPDADNKVEFEIENGLIMGVGNGHPSSQERDVFGKDEVVFRSALGGYIQVILKSDRSGKPVKLSATANGLKGNNLVIPVL